MGSGFSLAREPGDYDYDYGVGDGTGGRPRPHAEISREEWLQQLRGNPHVEICSDCQFWLGIMSQMRHNIARFDIAGEQVEACIAASARKEGEK